MKSLNNPRRYWPKRLLLQIVLAVAIFIPQLMLQPVLAQEKAQLDRPFPDKVLLQWKFEPGDVFRGEMRVNETIRDDKNKQFRNEHIYNYRWRVESVDSNKIATVVVTFDRIRFSSEWLTFEFDSSKDDPMLATKPGAKLNWLLYELRAMKSAQFTTRINAQGGLVQLTGAEGLTGPGRFTPGDLPALPKEPVRVGGTWSVETGTREGSFETRGRATYKLLRVERKGDSLLCHILGTNFTRHQKGAATNEMGPVTSTSRFDLKSGLFVGEELKSRLRTQVSPGRSVNVTLNSTRRMSRVEERLADAVKSGEYGLYFEGETPRPMVLGGARVHKPVEGVRKALLWYFYHGWSDTDRDGQPAPGELTGISRRFSADEPVNFVIYAVGLKDAELQVDFVSSHGEQLGSNKIPINANSPVAVRALRITKPGVYFFEFSLKNRHVLRVPVQIAEKSYKEEHKGQAAKKRHPAAMQGLVVVRVPNAEIRDKETVLRRCRVGDVLRTSQERDDLLLVGGKGKQGWIKKQHVVPFEKAHDYFTAAIKDKPNDALAYCGRGRFVWWTVEMAKDGGHMTHEEWQRTLDLAIADFNQAAKLDPAHELTFVSRGVAWGDKNEHEKAIRDFDVAIRINPKSAKAIRLRALAHWKLNAHELAIKDCTRAIELDENAAAAYSLRGICRAGQGEVKKGLADCSKAIAIDPESAVHYTRRGAAWAAAGDDAKAFADYNKAIQLDPTDVAARAAHARIQYQKGAYREVISDLNVVIQRDPKVATHHFRRGTCWLNLGDFDKAITDFDVAVQLDPSSAAIYSNRGVAFLRKEDHQKALADFTEAIRLAPDSPLNYRHRAELLGQLGRYDESVRDCDQLIKLTPKDALAFCLRGFARAQRGETDEGIADCNRAIQLDPQLGRAYSARGLIRFTKGERDKALSDLDRAIRLDAADTTARHLRARLYYASGNHRDAIDDLTEVLKVSSQNVDAYVGRGLAWYSERESQKAIADFTEAIKLAPDVPDFYVFRGSAWNQKGEPDAAIADFNRAIELRPESAAAFTYRGASWHSKGETRKAIADFTQALQIKPRFLHALVNRGGAWHALGDYRKAIDDLSEAIRTDPTFAEAYNSLAWIRATCPKAEYRDGKNALTKATKACELTNWKVPRHLDTLAAAYAEVGDFESAVKWQEAALKVLPEDARQKGRNRLKLYKMEQPYREAKPSGQPSSIGHTK